MYSYGNNLEDLLLIPNLVALFDPVHVGGFGIKYNENTAINASNPLKNLVVSRPDFDYIHKDASSLSQAVPSGTDNFASTTAPVFKTVGIPHIAFDGNNYLRYVSDIFPYSVANGYTFFIAFELTSTGYIAHQSFSGSTPVGFYVSGSTGRNDLNNASDTSVSVSTSLRSGGLLRFGILKFKPSEITTIGGYQGERKVTTYGTNLSTTLVSNKGQHLQLGCMYGRSTNFYNNFATGKLYAMGVIERYISEQEELKLLGYMKNKLSI